MKQPITIEQVANGFIVNGTPSDVRLCVNRASAHVFESMEALQRHISEHFEPIGKAASTVDS